MGQIRLLGVKKYLAISQTMTGRERKKLYEKKRRSHIKDAVFYFPE